MHPSPRIDCSANLPMTQDEKQFFKALGARIAELRKARGLAQVQLVETLELSQQMIASYEVGRRRVPVSLLPAIAHALAVSVEALIGERTPLPPGGDRPRSCCSKWSASSAYPKPSSASSCR